MSLFIVAQQIYFKQAKIGLPIQTSTDKFIRNYDDITAYFFTLNDGDIKKYSSRYATSINNLHYDIPLMNKRFADSWHFGFVIKLFKLLDKRDYDIIIDIIMNVFSQSYLSNYFDIEYSKIGDYIEIYLVFKQQNIIKDF